MESIATGRNGESFADLLSLMALDDDLSGLLANCGLEVDYTAAFSGDHHAFWIRTW
jgi:hypothetical protein